jgi:hypothetical protein
MGRPVRFEKRLKVTLMISERARKLVDDEAKILRWSYSDVVELCILRQLRKNDT